MDNPITGVLLILAAVVLFLVSLGYQGTAEESPEPSRVNVPIQRC